MHIEGNKAKQTAVEVKHIMHKQFSHQEKRVGKQFNLDVHRCLGDPGVKEM